MHVPFQSIFTVNGLICKGSIAVSEKAMQVCHIILKECSHHESN